MIKEQRCNKRQENASEVLKPLESISESEFENYRQGMAFSYGFYALESLESQLSETAIKVFKLSLEQVSSEDIADQLEITVGSVYTLKNRVKDHFTKIETFGSTNFKTK